MAFCLAWSRENGSGGQTKKKKGGVGRDMDKQTDGSVFGSGICIAVVYPHISLHSLFLSLSVCVSLFLSLFPSVSDSRVPEAAEAGDTCQHKDSVSSLSAAPLSLSLSSTSTSFPMDNKYHVAMPSRDILGQYSQTHTHRHIQIAFNSVGLDTPTVEATVMGHYECY